MDYDYFFENLKDKMHIYVPEEETKNFEEEIIYLLKYWFRERTVREHYFDFYHDVTWNRATINAAGGDTVCYKLHAITDILKQNKRQKIIFA